MYLCQNEAVSVSRESMALLEPGNILGRLMVIFCTLLFMNKCGALIFAYCDVQYFDPSSKFASKQDLHFN